MDISLNSSATSKVAEAPAITLHAHRKAQLFRMKIHWRIDCFSFQQHITTSIPSPTVRLPDPADGSVREVDGEWYLVLIPTVKSKRENEEKERDFVSLHLRRDSNKQVEVPTRFYLRIIDEEKNVVYHRDCAKPVVFSGKGSGSVMWGWDRYVAHEELFEKEGRRGHLIADPSDPRASRDTLYLEAEIHCLIGTETVGTCHERMVAVNTLEQDMKGVFDRKELTDFVLVSSDKIEILAHRAVLSARSEVFRAMFSHDTKEKLTGRMIVEDLDAETLTGMLEFIYGNSVSRMADLAEKLLIATDKYAIKGLKLACENYFIQSLSFPNAGRMAYLADTYDAGRLQVALRHFVNANYAACFASCPLVEYCLYLAALLDPSYKPTPVTGTGKKVVVAKTVSAK